MSESLDGLSVAVTRQNAGSDAKGDDAGGLPPCAFGGLNVPTATVVALVTPALGSVRALSASHEAAVAGAAVATLNATAATAPNLNRT